MAAAMERVSVVFRVKTPGLKAELQPPPDKESPSALWMERFTSLLKPLGNEGNAFRCCLCGTLEEVSSHLWQHQVLWMILRASNGDGTEICEEKHVAVPFSELLETNADLSSGRYSNDVEVFDEALDGSGRVIVGVALEVVRDLAGAPAGALRPSAPEAFVLTLEASEGSLALAAKAARNAGAAGDDGGGGCGGAIGGYRRRALRVRCGGVEHVLQEVVRCTLILVHCWQDVSRALLELDICVQVPVQDASDYTELPVDLSDLAAATEARGGLEIVSAVARSSESKLIDGRIVFEASVKALRWSGPGRPPEPGRSKDTELWVEGLAADPRTWRISVEIRSLRLTNNTANAFVAYFYEPFRQPRPFRTNPPTLARKNNTVYLPHSFAAYTLAATFEELRAQLEDPFRVEVWHRDTYRKDDLAAVADIVLSPVFDRPLQYSQSMPSMVRGFRVLDQACPLLGVAQPLQSKIGVVRVLLFLEDLGPAAVAEAAKLAADPTRGNTVMSDAASATHAALQRHDPLSARAKSGADTRRSSVTQRQEAAPEAHALDGLQAIRGSPAYSTAFELELWKRSEEDKFRSHLAEQEAAQRDRLEEEYRQRELARSREFRQKQSELRDIEAKAKKKLHELHQREVAVVAEEARVSSLREEVSRRTDSTIQDFEDASRRQVAEAQQSLHFERSRCHHLQSRVNELEADLATSRQRLRELEADFDERRRRLDESPAALLQRDLLEARSELQESRRTAATLAASRDHFKQKVEELCKRLLQTGGAAATGAAAQRKTPRQVVEQSAVEDAPISAAPLAGAENADLAQSLRKIQHDLAQLATSWSASPQLPAPSLGPSPEMQPTLQSRGPLPETANKSIQQQMQHLEWLKGQRDELLDSGLYQESDPVLQALDQRIAEAARHVGVA